METRLTDHLLEQLVHSPSYRDYHIIFQSLPKMGTTSIAFSLGRSNACHEYELDAIAQLSKTRGSQAYHKRIDHYLRKRKSRLTGKVDVCTSLYLVTAEMTDEEILSKGIYRFTLSRGFYTWLRSMTNWSELWKGYKYEMAWIKSLHAFVWHHNVRLYDFMPQAAANRRQCIGLWLPVWLTYQKLILNKRYSPINIYYQEDLRLASRKNVSSFDPSLINFITEELRPVEYLSEVQAYNQEHLDLLEEFYIKWVHENAEWRR